MTCDWNQYREELTSDDEKTRDRRKATEHATHAQDERAK
jgi:hypothetical protein